MYILQRFPSHLLYVATLPAKIIIKHQVAYFFETQCNKKTYMAYGIAPLSINKLNCVREGNTKLRAAAAINKLPINSVRCPIS